MAHSKKWSFKELNELCCNRGLPDSKVYQEALEWKRARVEYHVKQYNKIWNELFSSGGVKIPSEKWNCAQFTSEVHVESSAQVLHSMADILAQIINKVVPSQALEEGDVTLNKVQCQLEKRADTCKIVEAIKRLRTSKEFSYINAFVNTIKHQRLLQASYRMEYGENKRNEKAVCFKAFEYKGKCYDLTWATDIIGTYKSHMVEMIIGVGNAVNDYLRCI